MAVLGLVLMAVNLEVWCQNDPPHNMFLGTITQHMFLGTITQHMFVGTIFV